MSYNLKFVCSFLHSIVCEAFDLKMMEDFKSHAASIQNCVTEIKQPVVSNFCLLSQPALETLFPIF